MTEQGDDQTVVARTLGRRTARRPRRGPAFWAGIALLVAGLLLLGYVAWQLFGTNVVSHRKQDRIVEDTVRIWSGKGDQGTELHGADALVRIPAFGDDYVVPVQQGTSDEVLAEGFGHFRGTATPGQVGNFAIAGHRVTHGEPLRDMPSLRPGDRVVVETRTRTFTYRLDTNPNDLVVDLHSVWVLDPVPHNPGGGVQPAQRRGQRLITVTTCAELFHTDNRMIAFGHLVKSARR
jgi:sortase A